MDTSTRALYALAAIAGVQALGYFDYRLYYFTVCCLTWQALRVLTPTWTTNVELQVGWYVLKGGTTAARVCRPAINAFTGPVVKLLQSPETGDKIHVVGGDGITMHILNVDPPLRTELFPTAEPEFVMYEWRSGDASKYAAHLVRFDTVEKALSSPLDFKFSGIKFLAPTLTVWDGDNPTHYDMSPELSTNNYYICGNRLFDKPFIAWYLNKIHGVSLADRKYKVDFVDDKMLPQSLGDKQVLLLQRDSYTIVSVDTQVRTGEELRQRTPATSDRWARENECIKAGKESLSKVKVDPNAVPTHIRFPWGQYY